MLVDRGNPRRFHRSTSWKKAMDGFFHSQPESPLRLADASWRGLELGDHRANRHDLVLVHELPHKAARDW